jgi:hypothetical protein
MASGEDAIFGRRVRHKCPASNKMPANLAWTAGLVAEDCPEGYARHSHPRISVCVAGKGVSSTVSVCVAGKGVICTKMVQNPGIFGCVAATGLSLGDRRLENVEPTPTGVDFAPCDWRSTLSTLMG